MDQDIVDGLELYMALVEKNYSSTYALMKDKLAVTILPRLTMRDEHFTKLIEELEKGEDIALLCECYRLLRAADLVYPDLVSSVEEYVKRSCCDAIFDDADSDTPASRITVLDEQLEDILKDNGWVLSIYAFNLALMLSAVRDSE